jgi:hypothetical protein
MARATSGLPGKTRRVWRMTPGSVSGQYVNPDEVEARRPEPSERHAPGWILSSFELAYGLDVREFEDTMPTAFTDGLPKTPSE